MISNLFKLSLPLIIALLSACGPTYKTSFSYTPPGDIKGNSCLNECQRNQQDCEWNEEERYHNCEERATRSYEICEANKQYSYNYKKDRMECSYNCYCSKDSCAAADIAMCTSRYNTCYVGCGGTIVETTQCVSNCEKADPPTTQILRGARDK